MIIEIDKNNISLLNNSFINVDYIKKEVINYYFKRVR